MKSYKNDIAVLFIFFVRAEQTAKVFEQIRLARPSKLFLYQDGARPNRKDDLEGIKACRKIVENIDWECEVHRMYQEKNFGCDPSEYIAQKWMFSIVEKGIILEDDDVPSQSFFPFCKELLDKYENDYRIGMICGQNLMEVSNIESDYFFSKRGPIWGWASWRRVIDLWDPEYEWLHNDKIVKDLLDSGHLSDSRLKASLSNEASKREHYEDFCSITRILYNQLAIIPSKNMISNIGISNDGTHYGSNIQEIPPKQRRLLYMKTYEYEFPLNHPKYIYENKVLTDQMGECLRVGFEEKLFNKIIRIKKLFNL